VDGPFLTGVDLEVVRAVPEDRDTVLVRPRGPPGCVGRCIQRGLNQPAELPARVRVRVTVRVPALAASGPVLEGLLV
jgi:hypothetical protein